MTWIEIALANVVTNNRGQIVGHTVAVGAAVAARGDVVLIGGMGDADGCLRLKPLERRAVDGIAGARKD